jgi:hypothetical protein
MDDVIKNPTKEQIHAVSNRIEQAAYSMLAMYKLADEVVDSEQSAYGIAIKEMARANIKGLDACLQRLNAGAGCMGNFADELSGD